MMEDLLKFLAVLYTLVWKVLVSYCILVILWKLAFWGGI
ncbi:MAG: hypothetical protein [Bacteriophage sp.]|nr:MAG: hypothetical protein [Bacteriophage sp.]